MTQSSWYPANILIGIVLSLYFAFVFWTKRTGNLRANRYLSLFALALAMTLVDTLLFASTASIRFPHLFGLLWPMAFLVGPVLRWYVDSITDDGFRFGRNDLIHFIPAAAAVVALLPFYLLSAENKLSIITTPTPDAMGSLTIFTAIVITVGAVLHNGYYIVTAIERVVVFNRTTPPLKVPQRTPILQMLNYVAIGAFCVVLLFALSVGLHSQVGERLMLMSQTQMILDVFVFGCLLNWQSKLTPATLNREVGADVVAGSAEAAPKYQFSALSAEQGTYFQQRLLALMQTDKPYLNGKLTLPDLAEQLGLSPNYLSQIINERLDLSFRDFLNQYRVNEVQHRLLTEAERSILDVAFDAGFNSKSAFYDAFKKQVGMTPSQFRKTVPVQVAQS